ncbi:hypothetical protein IWX90DRAFT_138565 [Phyllosticta citrichinensis]|uniref:F-box domain-containing protein n=1 Tax=Phyllosticta citrichinensis TaxID=1130410 RepID=A0ABR1XYZ2_9PEZI
MPHEKSSSELLARGDIYYQDREFQRAITAYLEAFESSNDLNDVTPLDKAAACYLRTKDYNSALALTKKMSKVNAGDIRVYLRMGQALQLLQKSALATKIFAKGLQRCRPTAEGYDTLRKQYNLLECQERATNSVDPVNVLPYEMLDEIMIHLDFRCRVNLLRVSKRWQSYLTSNDRLWTDLDLSSSRRPVSRNCISKYIKWSNGRIHTVKLNRLSKHQSLWELGRQCQISSLSLLHPDISGSSITHPLMAFKTLQSLSITSAVVTPGVFEEILNQVPTLTILNIQCLGIRREVIDWQRQYPNLQHLRLNCVSDPGVSGWEMMSKIGPHELLKRIPNIRTLAITNFHLASSLDYSHLLHLKTLDLRGSDLSTRPPKLPESIRTLHISSIAVPFRSQETTVLPRLESLSLKVLGWPLDMHENPDLFLPPLLQHHTPLRRLALTPSPLLTQWKALLSTPRLARLEDIDIVDIPDTDEEQTCNLVLGHLPHLRRLRMEGFYHLTGWGIKQLVNGLEHLEELNLVKCPKIQFDSIEWARKKLQSVQWTPLQEASGKKVLWGS